MRALSRCMTVVLALAVAPVAAQTWTGAGADNNWSTGANWSGGVAPASSATTQLTFPGSVPRLSPIVDAPWTVNRMSFLASYTLTGQALTLAGSSPGIQAGPPTTLSNPITLTGPTSFNTISVLDFFGPISGTGPLTLVSVGGIALHGVNTYTGGTTVVSGGLGLQGTMLGPVTVSGPGASLGGTNGVVSGPVTVNAGGTIGGTLSTADLTVAGFVSMDIDGPAPGTQYDSIGVSGAVTLNNATLTLNGAYVPVAGNVFTLIANDGSDAVVGTFAGLPEGATLTFNGVPMRISYIGGTGNDVTLNPVVLLGAPHGTPTLSEWALLILATLMLALGLRGRSGRKAPGSPWGRGKRP